MAQKAYLMYVAGRENSNKYYNMEELGDGTFKATYGRVGASAQVATYPMSKWNTKFREKVRKGYTDVTDLHVVEKNDDNKAAEIEIKDAAVASFVKRLQTWSEKNVRDSYLIGVDGVTQMMVDRAQNVLSMMQKEQNITLFNAHLEELATIIPRRMSNVGDAMAKSSEDFIRILSREQNILNNMAAQVQAHTIKTNKDTKAEQDILEQLGLTAVQVTDEKELAMIRDMLGKNANQLKEAYLVSNAKTEARYENWKSEHNAAEHLYFHGSRRENFFSIWSLGFNIEKYAAYGMFGKGQYFANKAQKSLGYVNGGYWRGGAAADEKILGIFRVAYASQMDLYASKSNLDARVLRDKYKGKYDAVFAHAGPALYNDEIIVYDDAQSTIRYLLVMN